MTKTKIIRQYFKKFYNVDVEGMTPIAVCKKISGSWVQQTNLTQVFENGVNYKIN